MSLSQKADLALSNLTADGGLLNPEQNSVFIRRLIDSPTLLNRVRSVPMSAPTMKINKIQFGSRILQVAPQGTSPFAADAGTNSRWLAAANRAKPTTSQISLTTQEIMAEVHLPYELFEDNIEGQSLENTILSMIADRTALDLEELLILGDTALSGSDPYLGLMNGILKLSTSHVVDAAGATVSASIFNNMKKALPTKYRRNLNTMAFFVSMDRESDYRLAVAGRNTGLGDSILTGTQALPVLGVPMVGAALMPNANGTLLNPQNVIFGIQRSIRIEQDRDIRARLVHIVLTMRIAIQIEEEDAVVKLTNLG
jgi:HK97 family phage major capsid protein